LLRNTLKLGYVNALLYLLMVTFSFFTEWPSFQCLITDGFVLGFCLQINRYVLDDMKRVWTVTALQKSCGFARYTFTDHRLDMLTLEYGCVSECACTFVRIEMSYIVNVCLLFRYLHLKSDCIPHG